MIKLAQKDNKKNISFEMTADNLHFLLTKCAKKRMVN